MAKALCMSGMVVAILIAILFTLDLVAKIPFRRASLMMDVSLVICAIILGLISWMTLREQA
jgi:energy-coupling factor transporter transmembrane protein EcfT